jgi:Flp pilus assembly protein TadG
VRRRRQAARPGDQTRPSSPTGGPGGHAARCRDRGSYTAELAAGLPALVLLLVAGLAAVGAVITKAQCVDAAREAALAASRGEPGAAAAAGSAPPGAEISVAVSGDTVVASVRAPVRAFGAGLPRLTVAASAAAAVEPGAPAPAP